MMYRKCPPACSSMRMMTRRFQNRPRRIDYAFFHHGLEQELSDWIWKETHDHVFISEWNGGYIVQLVQERETDADEDDWQEAPWVIQHAVPIQLFLLLTTLLFAGLWITSLSR
ncbi:hypothetical protein [Desmospora profundinema]|uniref:Uncharacterized protein n=1 Tax=Desmospora profundinema TaxID=1571184 RepID=A0ABU1ISP1_9BACL|nr:hypothetical protein [Desmospora profundinema]MDR6227214.1 hypothetical protein [Desmospora profundinema]